MKKPNQYEWLIVAEGSSDIAVYNQYLYSDAVPKSFRIMGVGGKGINIPRDDTGCLETELLASYGFPVKSQDEYESLIDIIKRATTIWGIPDNKDGNPWWGINEKAKMDKFIYAALRHGFKVVDKTPPLPKEPDVIENIRIAMT